MRLFELHRDEDETGISGTGKVAQGVIFANGQCALTWLTDVSSVAIYANVADVVAIHGHGGKTRVVQVANIDVKKALKCAQDAMLDDMENIGCEFTTSNHRYVWGERQKLADMFEAVNLGEDGVDTRSEETR